jgi:glycosyltransferase involved in cell wall biosynthesis
MKDAVRHIRTLIALPAYNEEQHIGDVLMQLGQWKDDVIVIDDGSTDNTARLVTGLGFRCHSLQINSGLTAVYTLAEKLAVTNKYTHILTLDADGQHDAQYIPAFLKAMEKYDLVLGSRFHATDLIPESKIASNLFAILLLREVLNIALPDVSCGFRGWKTGQLFSDSIPGNEPAISQRFGIIYEMLLKHILKGKQAGFVNIPAIYHHNDPLNTKITEIAGLLSMVHKYKNSNVLQSVIDDVLNKRNFSLHLSGFRFDAILVSDDAFVFKTEITDARQFFKSIQNQPVNEYKS